MVLVGIALVVLLIVAMVRAERKRREALAAWAFENQFTPFEANRELEFLKNYEAWGPGYGHKNFDGYEGKLAGAELKVWQHQSRTKSKDSENIHNFTVLALEMPVPAPNLRIKREHFGHKLVDAFGGEDIDFESDEFSRKFWVKCNDRKFAYDVIHPRMMEFFLTAPNASWQWQGKLVLHVPGSFKPQRVQPLIDAAAGMVQLLPKHL